jgi:hypothetical protein
MGIVELGALGEFVGSIAVLATLIYLSFQVREARAESRSSLLQHRNDAARSLWMSEASNPELVAALVKGDRALGSERTVDTALVEHAGLTREEARMVVNSFLASFFHRQTLYLSRLTDAERRTLDRQLALIFSRGLPRLWFENIPRETFDPAFVAHVEGILSSSESAGGRGQ